MANTLIYNGYHGTVEYSADDMVLHGKLIAVNDLITYEAQSVDELKQAFEEAVEDYIETCKELGKQPNKMFKGSFNVRTSTQTHKRLALLAAKKDMKLNNLVNKALEYVIKNEDEVLN